MNLSEKLLYNISKAIKYSLNEMARRSVTRTIDNKLWLSVASTCSRNRSNDAEFIKPLGSDKNILLLKYVAALIIMKKPCPLTELDIDNNKTFKLVGKRLLSLGVTFDEIQKLYNENTGVIHINSKPALQLLLHEESELDNTEESDVLHEIPKKHSGSIFDDDLFDDDESTESDINVTENLLGLDKDASLEAFLSKTYNISKPKGWYFGLSTPDTYEYLERRNVQKLDPSGSKDKLSYDVYKILVNLQWILYRKPDNRIYDFGLQCEDSIETLSKKIQDKDNWAEDFKQRNLEYIKQYKNNVNKFIENIPDPWVKKLFQDNPYLEAIMISPDRGLYLAVIHRPVPAHVFDYKITFTGLVNYNSELKDIENKKDYILKVRNKNKNIEAAKKKFKKLISKYCGFGKWDINRIIIDDDNYPMAAIPYSKIKLNDQYKSFTKLYYTVTRYRKWINGHYSYRYEKSDPHYFYIDADNKEYKNSIFEVVLDKDYFKYSYVKCIGIQDHKYDDLSNQKDGGGYVLLIKLTDEGKRTFDNFNGK